ncbi:MAG TPA: sulfotransferase domain-containing protein [Saprospiraceae bacterium]|nr:sulfotransferase domain-containing protein [Saprospiraceae bacterium]
MYKKLYGEYLLSVSNSLRLRPDVFIAGFQKCGTTSLYNYIIESGQFVPGKVKENNELAKERHSINKYLKLFPYKFQAAGKRTLCASHQIGFVPYGASRIKKYFPEAKVVFIVRNPVARALSRYEHNQRKINPIIDKKFPYSFYDLCDIELNILNKLENQFDYKEVYEKTSYCNPYGLVLSRGFYYVFIKSFLEVNINVYVLCLEELENNFEEEMQKLFDYLGVDNYQMPQMNKYNTNSKGIGIKPSIETMDLLKSLYKKHNELLFSYIKRKLPWE